MERQFKKIKFWLNDREVETMVDVRASLTDLLRNDFRMTSVKKAARWENAAPAMCSLTANASIPASI